MSIGKGRGEILFYYLMSTTILGRILKAFYYLLGIINEILAWKMMDLSVQIGMGRNLMAFVVYFADKVRVFIYYPTQTEESRFKIISFQKCQQDAVESWRCSQSHHRRILK